MSRHWVKIATFVPLGLLMACTDQEAQQAADDFGDALGRFFLMLMIFALIAAIIWSLIIAGGVAAIMAGIRRLRRDEEQASREDPSGVEPPPLPPDSATAPDTPRPVQQQQEKRPTDLKAIGLIVFGAILLLSAGPGFGGFDLFGTRRSGGITISITMESLLLVGAVIAVVLFVRKRRNR